MCSSYKHTYLKLFFWAKKMLTGDFFHYLQITLHILVDQDSFFSFTPSPGKSEAPFPIKILNET